MTLDGIDISSHQIVTPSLAGLAFVWCKATEGSTFIDPMYSKHSQNVRAAGLVLGAYHYGNPTAPVPDQVASFLSVAGRADLWALDVEAGNMTDAQARAFIAAVRATGRAIGLYHSRSGFPDYGQSYNWVADWTGVPAMHWTFHQYQGSPLDRDHFAGDQAALDALAGRKTMPLVTLTRYGDPAPGRRWTVKAGTTLSGYDPARPGSAVVTVTFTKDSSAHADGEAGITWPGIANPPIPKGGPFLRVTDGTFAGLYIVKALVTVDPAPILYTAADLQKAAQAAGTARDATWHAWLDTHPKGT